ncbi:MAG: hypothetical protein KME64_21265 [Scytonematopsis contorta HA4267-MV1]|jgi:hypothetical protein|nr:hypothetical protein [Scytonematopsis contorta HA4267-MV1]
MIFLAVTVYAIMGSIFFIEWLDYFLADEDMSQEMRRFSSFVLIIATALWPIVVPLAYLEVLRFQKKHKTVIELLRKTKKTIYNND